MKKTKVGGNTIKYYTPEFDTFVAKGMISVKKHPSFPDVVFPSDKVEQERVVTLCQIVVPIPTEERPMYIISTGVSLLDPKDTSPAELGRKIAEGRALKHNIKCLETVTSFKPNAELKAAINSLAKRHVEDNIDMYVSQMHDALKL